MKSSKLVIALVLATVSGAALAGKAGTPGAGSNGSGTFYGSDSALNGVLGYGLVNVPNNPGLFRRVSNLPGAVILADGSVVSPPVRTPDGRVIRITVTPDGGIVRVEEV